MIRLNRTTEYGLIALRHMAKKRADQDASVTSAREVADVYALPFEITAKTLQRLRDTGIIQSAHGARGGYTLNRALQEITLGEFLEMMEGPQSVVGCATSLATTTSCQCEYQVRCEIKDVMSDLNDRIRGFLAGIRLDELMDLSKNETTASAGNGGSVALNIPVARVAAPAK